MTNEDLFDLDDVQLIAALQGALERAQADEREAAARVAKYARALSVLDDAPSDSRFVNRESRIVTLPPNAAAPRPKPTRGVGGSGARVRDRECPNCSRMFAAQGFATHVKSCGGLGPIGHLPVDEQKARDAAAGPRVTLAPSNPTGFAGRVEQKPTPPKKPEAFSVDDAHAHLDSLAAVR